ncbi:oxidoreductase [Apiospora rasikravindrae]|uniref:Oxidoreductase n=1 Tax=Apiospora rasikravindrae TaxID=990691 RepID=A0ABR1T739_9PEZI
MASDKPFEDAPPFPDDVPVIPLNTISLAALHSGDKTTARDVLTACRELGFFLLDLRGDVLGKTMMEEVDQLFGVGKDILNLPEDTKQRYLHDIPKSFLGFKPRGQAKIETNEPDRFEWFNLGQDSIMGTETTQSIPPLVQTHMSLFASFLEHGQSILATINTTLATQLALPPDAFTCLQKPTRPSGTVVRIIKAFASERDEDVRTSMIHHTDFGTVTLLANVIGGLQVLAPGKSPTDQDAWGWVRPQPGCLIVNLGDAMVQWTGGVLRSNVHRVNCAPGQQRFVDRYSLAILARPERNASMRKLVDGLGDSGHGEDDSLTAWEWEVKKAMSLKRGDAVTESTGGEPRSLAT